MFEEEENTKCYNATNLKYQDSGETTYGPLYHNSFFYSYQNFRDAKDNVKAVIMRPIVDLSLTVSCLMEASIRLLSGVINLTVGCITLDGEEAWDGVKGIGEAFNQTISACYFAITAVTDCLDAVLRILTHSLSTIGCAVLDAGAMIVNCLTQ